MRIILQACFLLSLSACSPDVETDISTPVSEIEVSVDNESSDPIFKIPTEEDRARDVLRVEEHREYLAKLAMSPWITKSNTAVLREGFESTPIGVQSEDGEIAKIAFDYLRSANYSVSDNLKVLIEKQSDIATVTIEAPIQEGHLGADYTLKIFVDTNSQEVTNSLIGA